MIIYFALYLLINGYNAYVMNIHENSCFLKVILVTKRGLCVYLRCAFYEYAFFNIIIC